MESVVLSPSQQANDMYKTYSSMVDTSRLFNMTNLPEKARRMPGMENIFMFPCNGINYPVGSATKDYYQQMTLMRDLQLNEDDVITIGFPRSGNHWTFEIIHMIQNQTTSYAPFNFNQSILDMMGESVQEEINSRPSPRNLGQHFYMKYLPQQALEKRLKLIYILRNPKDVMVSMYRLFRDIRYDNFRFSGSWSDFFNAHMSGEFLYGTWIDHVLEFEEFRKEHPELSIHIHSFEETKCEPVKAIKKLSHFLGKPGMEEQISEAVSFQAMKEGTKNKMGVFQKQAMKEGADGLMSKGKVCGWKDWFTEEQNEEFNRIFEQKLDRTESGDIARKYIL